MILACLSPGLNWNPLLGNGLRPLGAAVVLDRRLDLVVSMHGWQGCAEGQLDDQLGGLAIFSVD
jgi:hypothetical protein